jgi:hypothetical protein
MREVHLGAGVLEHVSGPVPAVSGFQHHLRILAGLRDLLRKRHRIVVDPHGVQPVPGLIHPHDHRPAAVQIDTHDLRAVVLC